MAKIIEYRAPSSYPFKHNNKFLEYSSFEMQLGCLTYAFVITNVSFNNNKSRIIGFLQAIVSGFGIAAFAHTFLKNISDNQKKFTLVVGFGLYLVNLYNQYLNQRRELNVLNQTIKEFKDSSSRVLLITTELSKCLSPLRDSIGSFNKIRDVLDNVILKKFPSKGSKVSEIQEILDVPVISEIVEDVHSG